MNNREERIRFIAITKTLKKLKISLEDYLFGGITQEQVIELKKEVEKEVTKMTKAVHNG